MIISKVYLSPLGVTRAEKQLFLSNAQMRTLFGRTNMNPPSRFLKEIPEDIMESLNIVRRQAPTSRSSATTPFGTQQPQRKATIRSATTNTGGAAIEWNIGDKAVHGKWGTGTVVSVKGEGESKELDIAFPSPVGIKRLLAKFAPIQKG